MTEPELTQQPSGFICPHCRARVKQIYEFGFVTPAGFFAKAYACENCQEKAKEQLKKPLGARWN